MEKEFALTVLSNGGGQDTTYLIQRLIEDKEFYKKHVSGDLIIVGSDTGDEHDHTYSNIKEMQKMCDMAGFKFVWVTPDMQFHSPSWQSLTGQYTKNSSIGSAAYKQTCTDNLKVKVVDRFVEWYLQTKYRSVGARKRAYHHFYETHGRIKLILGFAKGEERRTQNSNAFDPVWKKKVVERYYPLIEDGISRQDCIDFFEARNRKVYPSNCKRCFYQSPQEILWLWRNDRPAFLEWVEMEEAKIKKYNDLGKTENNYGVYGKKSLWDKLQEAENKFGHMTDAELDEYKMSHGHCIKSKY